MRPRQAARARPGTRTTSASEYDYAESNKGASKMLAVVLEDEMCDTTKWGRVEFVLGNKLYVTMRRDRDDEMDAQFGFLCQQLANMGVVPQLSSAAGGAAAVPSVPADTVLHDRLHEEVKIALSPSRQHLSLLKLISRLEYAWNAVSKEQIRRHKTKKFVDAKMLLPVIAGIKSTVSMKNQHVQDHGAMILRCARQITLLEQLEESASAANDLDAAIAIQEKRKNLQSAQLVLEKMRSAEMSLDWTAQATLGTQEEFARALLAEPRRWGEFLLAARWRGAAR